jgi:hypothetical protein
MQIVHVHECQTRVPSRPSTGRPENASTYVKEARHCALDDQQADDRTKFILVEVYKQEECLPPTKKPRRSGAMPSQR